MKLKLSPVGTAEGSIVKPISGRITPHFNFQLTRYLSCPRSKRYGYRKVAVDAGVAIHTFRDLQDAVAYLGYYNPGVEIFLRAQSADYKTAGDISSIYPTIYRGLDADSQTAPEDLARRILSLEAKETKLLKALDTDKRLPGRASLVQHDEARWALLQHYKCCATPLVDVTRNTRVAASFVVPGRADEPKKDDAYIYVLGLPYQTGNITHNFSENIRILNLRNLLGHNARRPHEQEGYLVGSLYTWKQPDESHNLAVRLLGKLRIPMSEMTSTAGFWGSYDAIPRIAILPPDDDVKDWLSVNDLAPDSVQ